MEKTINNNVWILDLARVSCWDILIGVPVAEVTLNDAVFAINVDHLGW